MTTEKRLTAALYARVSTADQTTENQLFELRRYAEARGWTIAEYVDHAVSGTQERRPALDKLMAEARRRRVDVLVTWRLDRLGRNLKHLINSLEELQTLGVAFVSLNEGIDATTPAGRLQMAVLGAIAQFERDRSWSAFGLAWRVRRRKADDSDAGRRGSWINRIALLSI